MSYVLNETQWAKYAIDNKDLGKNPYETLRRVARYYIDTGVSRGKVRENIESFLKSCDKTLSVVKWSAATEAAITFASKHKAINVGEISITKAEMDTIQAIDIGNQTQRLAFTLLCFAKYWNVFTGSDSGWVNSRDSDIMREANIKTTIKRQCKLYRDLNELGLISFSSKVDCTNVRVDFINNDSPTVMKITDFRSLGNQYLIYCGEPYFKCAECGIIEKIPNKKGRKPKYCSGCAAKVRSRQNNDYYKTMLIGFDASAPMFLKDVRGYEGLYAVTSCGRVWSYRQRQFLTPTTSDAGYLFVMLCKDGKKENFRVHRLVADAYIPNPNGLPFVKHRDECLNHNWVSNLEWCDAKYSSNYGTAPLRYNRMIRCKETGEIVGTVYEAADIFKTTSAAVYSSILHGYSICDMHYEFVKIDM